MVDFEICDDYLKYLKGSKFNFGGLCVIYVLDNEGILIGEYSVYMEKYMNYSDLNEIKKYDILILICLLSYVVVGNEIRFWDKWRFLKLNKKNEWFILSDEDRIVWLNIVMKYYLSYKRFFYILYENISGGIYYLDGINIIIYELFFCVFGEVMNGLGGYYGFDELNLMDCLIGGFRVCCLFKLIWKNFIVVLKNLIKEEWENYIKRREK